MRHSLTIIMVSTLALFSCGQPDLSSCIVDIDAAKNSPSLIDKENGEDKFNAIKTDMKFARCFVDELGIKRSWPDEKKAQAVLDHISSAITYAPDKNDVPSSDRDRPGTKLPSRTVVDKKGDCEDLTVLAAVMLKELNVPAFIVHRPPVNGHLGHIFIGIKTRKNTGIKCGDAFILSLDPSLPNPKLGDIEAGVTTTGTFGCWEI